MGKNILTVLLILMIIATAVADLGFMHALNEAWPPHAKLHAIWSVVHVTATHIIALALLWVGPNAGSIIKIRIVVGIMLAFITSFFIAVLFSPLFGASVHPDLPLEKMPPTVLGMDGNMIGFLIVVPFVLYAWWHCEKYSKTQ